MAAALTHIPVNSRLVIFAREFPDMPIPFRRASILSAFGDETVPRQLWEVSREQHFSLSWVIKTGAPYVFRPRLPDGYSVAPLWHPMDENVTVISGVFRVGVGEKFDEHALREICPLDLTRCSRMVYLTITASLVKPFFSSTA
jgi:hypothetical protein